MTELDPVCGRPVQVQLDLDRWRALTSDTEVWGLPDIARELHLNRTTAHRLRVARRNVAEGRIAAWPPRGPELEKLQPVVGTMPEPWWTDCVSVLPAVDFPGTAAPRWYAGTIRKWAMRTGRMTPDGQVLTPPKPGTRPRPTHGADVDIDLSRLSELLADMTVWKGADIAQALAVDPEVVAAWARVTTNYTAQGMRTWPPEAHSSTIAKARKGPRLQDWPPHWRCLPPPDITVTLGLARDRSTRQQHALVEPRWYAGTIRKWAMRTGRMTPDGQAVPLRSRRLTSGA